MADGFVQVAPDSLGKKIDNSELTRADGTVVERQRVVLGDDLDPTRQAGVDRGALKVQQSDIDRGVAERQYLQATMQLYVEMATNESASGNRRGFEIR